MNEDTFAELSAGYALGALSPEDELAYREALAAHPEWAQIADDDATVVAQLADGVSEVAPPLDIRSRLLRQIAGADAAAAESARSLEDEVRGIDDANDDEDDHPVASGHPTGSPETDQFQTIQRRTWTRSLFALTASVALLVGIGWGVGSLTESLRAPTAESVLAQIEEAGDAESNRAELADGGEATLHWSPSVEGAVLVADGLPQIADDQSYEAWYVRGEQPVSAGVFESSDGSAALLLDGDLAANDVIALTIEPDGGSPSGAPTSDPVFAIPMV